MRSWMWFEKHWQDADVIWKNFLQLLLLSSRGNAAHNTQPTWLQLQLNWTSHYVSCVSLQVHLSCPKDALIHCSKMTVVIRKSCLSLCSLLGCWMILTLIAFAFQHCANISQHDAAVLGLSPAFLQWCIPAMPWDCYSLDVKKKLYCQWDKHQSNVSHYIEASVCSGSFSSSFLTVSWSLFVSRSPTVFPIALFLTPKELNLTVSRGF